jgi:hypothetical protein
MDGWLSLFLVYVSVACLSCFACFSPPVEAAPTFTKLLSNIPSLDAKKSTVALMALWQTWGLGVELDKDVVFKVMDQGYEEACLINALIPSLNIHDEEVAKGLMSRVGTLVQIAEDSKDSAWKVRGGCVVGGDDQHVLYGCHVGQKRMLVMDSIVVALPFL